MGFVQCFVLMLSAHLVLTFPPTQRTYIQNGRRCNLCTAGTYKVSCTECAPCPAGKYTSDWNREVECHRCYGDCSPKFHQKVVEQCSSTSDMKCDCEAGFSCAERVPYSENCRVCVKIPDKTKIQDKATTEAAAVAITDRDKQTPSPASSGYGSTSSKPCRFSTCDNQPVPAQNISKPENKSIFLAALLCPLFLLGCSVLLIRFCIHRSRGNTCFSQTVEKLCKEKGHEASHRPMDSSQQFPRDSFSAKQPPSALSATNLGPVYVQNPGTIIFSLLSQFTGQVGPTVEGGKTSEGAGREEEEDEEEEEERDCPVCHPMSPHGVRLSEEEKSEDADGTLFPSQEQGKDYHMSKEEVL
ncbi:tumor necrosis factor receptor superfamily member 5 isoform X2 [Salarias fasciatus]|uniref:tumor necrosis factor receptor superfamily member 5 isoform X2 n=1 Tax=Salarias fasciatus TaxID=181472 RepID=UPI001176C18F|nr:tumor necrosis factor receptor superfamily member 5-like isoform X2 [Salarias fasciatus]